MASLGCVQDHPRRVLAFFPPAVTIGRHGIQVGARSAQRGVHIGNFALHQLEFTDAAAELFALVNIGFNDVEAVLHDAHRPGGQHGALVVQARHQYPHTAVFPPQDIFRRHPAILENQFAGIGAAHAQLVELFTPRETRLCRARR